MLPLAVLEKEVRSTADLSSDRYEWIGFAEEEAEYVLYTDDGITRDYVPKEKWERIKLRREDTKELL